MRKSLLVGLMLAVAAVAVMGLSVLFDLEIESVVLLGAGVGAVTALVPDRAPATRLLGFVAGVLVALAGYVARAAVLPDVTSGRAVAVGLVIVSCVGVVVLSRDRLPLWAPLLGAGSFAGAYELVYAAAPPQVASTSLSTLTSLLVAVAVGFAAAGPAAPGATR